VLYTHINLIIIIIIVLKALAAGPQLMMKMELLTAVMK